jgi:hypothetical protein
MEGLTFRRIADIKRSQDAIEGPATAPLAYLESKHLACVYRHSVVAGQPLLMGAAFRRSC